MLPPASEACSPSSELKLGAAVAAEAEFDSQPSPADGSSIRLISSLGGASIALAVGSKPNFLASGAGISLARAGAAAAAVLAWAKPLCGMPACGVLGCEVLACEVLDCGVLAARGAAASNSDFPAASAALRKADAIGSAMGLRGCQGYCLDGSDSAAKRVEFSALETGESGMYSSKAASTASGCGMGSASSSKAEALAAGGAALDCGGGKAAATECEATAAGASEFEIAAAALAACPLRSRPRATRSVPLDCST